MTSAPKICLPARFNFTVIRRPMLRMRTLVVMPSSAGGSQPSVMGAPMILARALVSWSSLMRFIRHPRLHHRIGHDVGVVGYARHRLFPECFPRSSPSRQNRLHRRYRDPVTKMVASLKGTETSIGDHPFIK